MSSVDFGNIRFEDGTPRLSSKVMGVNVEDILDGLKQAQRIPILKKETQIETNTKKLAAMSEMETALNALKSSIQKLRDPGLLSSTTDVFKAKAAFVTSATLANPAGIVGISATQGAQAGTFNMKVLQVASTDQRVTSSISDKSADLITSNGTLSLNGVDVNLTENMSLQDVADAINGKSNTSKVKAQVLQLSDGNARMVLTGTDTGDVIDIDGSASVLSDLQFTVPQRTSTANASLAGIGTGVPLVINGTTVNLDQTDSLSAAAQKINDAGITNIVASVHEDAAGNRRLLINSSNVNTSVDLTGTDAALSTALGYDTVPAQTSRANASLAGIGTGKMLSINGTDVSLDQTDSLSDIANKINTAAIPNVSASIYTESGGAQRLVIKSTTGDIDFSGTNSDVSNKLGFSTENSNTRLVDQLSAKVEYNGLVATRSTNTFSDLVPGLTFDVYQAAPNDSISVSVENDLGGAKEAIAEMVDAYNTLADFIDVHQAISSDGSVSEDAILYGNSLLRAVDTQFAGLMVGGLNGIRQVRAK